MAFAIGRTRRGGIAIFAALEGRPVLRRGRLVLCGTWATLFGARLALRRGLVRGAAGIQPGLFAGRTRLLAPWLRGARCRSLGIGARLLRLPFALLRGLRLGRLGLARGLALGALGLFGLGARLLRAFGGLGTLGLFLALRLLCALRLLFALLLGALWLLFALGLGAGLFLPLLRRGLLFLLLLLLPLLLALLLLLLQPLFGAALQNVCLALGHRKLGCKQADDGDDCGGRLEDATHDSPFPMDAGIRCQFNRSCKRRFLNKAVMPA